MANDELSGGTQGGTGPAFHQACGQEIAQGHVELDAVTARTFKQGLHGRVFLLWVKDG
jgi:hypothetical protein